MKDIKQEILDAIDVDEFWHKEFPEWDGDYSVKVNCPRGEAHEEGDDSTESLQLSDTGHFRCYGCGWKGTSVVGYATDLHYSGNFRKALAVLYKKYVGRTVSPSTVKAYNQNLLRSKGLVRKIQNKRGWLEHTMKLLRLGWDRAERRMVFPIYNREGYCLTLRYHDTLCRDTNGPKMKAMKNGGSMHWFPLNPKVNPFLHQEVWCLEGEPDAILAHQEGLNCVTVTGGVNAWNAIPYDRLTVFEGKDVIICFDNDKPGIEAAKKFVTRLAQIETNSVKVVKIPYPGADLTNYLFDKAHTIDELKGIARDTNYTFKTKKSRVVQLPLAETSRAEHNNRQIRSDVIIAGKHSAPYQVPKRLTLTCQPGQDGFCTNCPCADREGNGEYVVHSDDSSIIQWLHTKQDQIPRLIKRLLSLPSRCQLNAEVETTQEIETIRLIPALTSSKQQNDNRYVERDAYYLGHGIRDNAQYNILAVPTIDPKNRSVLLVKEVSESHDSISNFSLSVEQISGLRSLFRDPPDKILKSVARTLSRNVTRIVGRPDLHVAVDLCFHSPLDFSFDGVPVPKGSMELLLLGDTRCGKGQVAEGLVRFYDLGSVVSGENASFMGLVGGAKKSSNGEFMLSWGAFPINNGRLVVVDEFSGLSEDVLGRTSRVRSEGIAEIDKAGHHAKTQANVRTIWIANPKKGRSISEYNTGVEAIMQLVSAQEDLARFDLALVVSKDEVAAERINLMSCDPIKSKYNQEDLRLVILWVWSRRPEQVQFTDRAVSLIKSASVDLAQKYDPSIPLVQGENIRFKLAKISSAIAGRCFSTPDGNVLQVKEDHVLLALRIINAFYDKPATGYLAYSQGRRSKNQLVNKVHLHEFFKDMDNTTREEVIDGMLECLAFGKQDMMDWLDCEQTVAQKMLGTLVRCHAIKKMGRGEYHKRADFTKWLRNKQRRP